MNILSLKLTVGDGCSNLKTYESKVRKVAGFKEVHVRLSKIQGLFKDHEFVSEFVSNIAPTAKVIWRKGTAKSHLTNWRSWG